MYMCVYIYIYIVGIGIMFRMFANGPGDLGSIPGRVIPSLNGTLSFLA